jgi:hypothetical protein
MSKGFLIYDEMRKYLVIHTVYEEAVSHIYNPVRISLNMRKIFFSFLSVLTNHTLALLSTHPLPIQH